MTNIGTIVEEGLCIGCGTCAGACPNLVIKMIKDDSKGIYLPKVDNGGCDNCGICLEVCPGHSVDYEQLNLGMFGKYPEDVLIGNYVNCYSGYANDDNIRYNSASGGIVTALLIFALEEGVIDGAIVTRMKKDEPLEPEPFIARTKEEIIEASKSKYCPVPVNTVLREILWSKKNERYAIVGLPCHIQGIRKAQKYIPELKKKIVFAIGLVCNHTPMFLATEYILKEYGIARNNLKKIEYRSKGWPGGMTLFTKDDKRYFLPHFSLNYWSFVFGRIFFPNRCLLCSDKICELSDISVMDAWSPEIMLNNKQGTSFVISRTLLLDNLLKTVYNRKVITLSVVEKKMIYNSQSLIHVRKRAISMIYLYKLFHKKIPDYTFYKKECYPKINIYDLTKNCFFYMQNRILSKRVCFRILKVYVKLISITILIINKISPNHFSNICKDQEAIE